MLAFVPGIAPQVPAAAGPGSGARRRPLPPARPLPCGLGLCPGLQLRAGLPLHTGQTPAQTSRYQPLPARLAGLHRCAQRPALRLPSPSTTSHRQTAASRDLVSPRRYLSWPQPLDNDSNSSPTPWRGRPAFHLQGAHSLPTPRDTFYSCRVAARSQGCPAAKSSHSFSPVDLLVLPSTLFSSEFAAVSLMCAFCSTQ